MRNFKQYLTEATIENFPDDFEKVLNYLDIGTWTLKSKEELPSLYGNGAKMGIEATYRGMAESGRHYLLTVGVIDQMYAARGDEPVEYDHKNGSKNIVFNLSSLDELGNNMKYGNETLTSSHRLHKPDQDSFFATPVQVANAVRGIIRKHEQQKEIPNQVNSTQAFAQGGLYGAN